jgi:hypothetical protein
MFSKFAPIILISKYRTEKVQVKFINWLTWESENLSCSATKSTLPCGSHELGRSKPILLFENILYFFFNLVLVSPSRHYKPFVLDKTNLKSKGQDMHRLFRVLYC